MIERWNRRNAGATASNPVAESELDDPVWSCLSTHHAHLARGGDLAKRYPAEISPIAAIAGATPAHVAALEDLFAPGDTLAIAGPFVPALGPEWETLRETRMLQMVMRERVPMADPVAPIVSLSEADVDEMLALVELTHPGPFRAQTIRLGGFVGVRRNGRLVAMAGERMRISNHREISAVCTHPDATRCGYARMLMGHVIDGMLRAGLVPFLHVETANERAIALYRALGFVERVELPLLYAKRMGGAEA